MIKKARLRTYTAWLAVGVLGAMLGAPNAMITKSVTGEIDSLTLTALRMAIIAVACLPAIILARRKISVKSFSRMTLAGIFLGISINCFAASIQFGQASYTSILALLAPIFLVIYSKFLLRDRISRRVVMGVLIAALGATVLLVVPLMTNGLISLKANPLATIFGLANAATYPLGIIFLRKSNEDGIPMMATIGFGGIICVVLTVVVAALFTGGIDFQGVTTISPFNWVAVFYSALMVALVSRTFNIKSFEHVGAAVEGGLTYLQVLIGIAMPLIILKEQLSIEIFVGAGLILTGIYLAETGARRAASHHDSYRRTYHLHHLHHMYHSHSG
jgi:drug/metabolite transporter (DMT)-like permease